MSQQTYPVACECGKVHQCPAGYAGTRFACHCGKAVEVPALSILRTTVIEGETTAETEVAARGRLGQLPLEEECVLCGQATDGAVSVLVECERPKSRLSAPAFIIGFVVFACFGWVGVVLWYLFGRMTMREVVGNYVAYELPVRVCDGCGNELTNSVSAMRAVMCTSLYARLLANHPNAFVVASSAAPGKQFANPYRTRARRRRLMLWSGVASGIAVFTSSLWMGCDHVVPMFPDRHASPGSLLLAAIAVVALGGGVLTGWGVSRLVGNAHRHFYPDEPQAG